MIFPLSTFHFPLSGRSRRNGFTLIEILVATTILLVIVILASLVFQQTTGAYQTGERKVNAQVALRNVIGTMTRDLALAVDSRDYPGAPENDFPKANSKSDSISFIALTGSPGRNAKGEDADPEYRTAQRITYSSSGTRTAKPMKCERNNGKLKWTVINNQADQAVSSLYDRDSFLDIKEGTFDMSFACDWPSDTDADLPERVHIRVELEGGGQPTVVGAGSGGRRGWGSPDEIHVGFKP